MHYTFAPLLALLATMVLAPSSAVAQSCHKEMSDCGLHTCGASNVVLSKAVDIIGSVNTHPNIGRRLLESHGALLVVSSSVPLPMYATSRAKFQKQRRAKAKKIPTSGKEMPRLMPSSMPSLMPRRAQYKIDDYNTKAPK